jgi:hypothetical protein
VGFVISVGSSQIYDQRIRPGEFVMRVLFSEFTAQAEKKIEMVMSEPSVCLMSPKCRNSYLCFVSFGKVTD